MCVCVCVRACVRARARVQMILILRTGLMASHGMGMKVQVSDYLDSCLDEH